MAGRKFYTGKYDKVFKAIICNQDRPEMLQEFLSRLLNRKVEVLEYLQNELTVTSVLEKTKILDVFVKADNDYIHIELNIIDPSYLHQRTFIQFCRYYANKVKVKDNYQVEDKFYVYNLVYGMKKERKTESEEEIYYIMNQRQTKYIDNVEFHEMDMDMIQEFWYTKNIEKVSKYKHLVMLDLETDDLKQLSGGDDFVEKFEHDVTNLNQDEEFLSIMEEAEEDARKILNSEKLISFQEGVEHGIEQGGLEANRNNALRFLEKGVDIHIISECTGLSIKEIEELAKN